ncbi:MAG: cytochrome c1 [Pseudomonadota bacterium]|nr:cytochrome c1 [Pseudomonadota bacterium]
MQKAARIKLVFLFILSYVAAAGLEEHIRLPKIHIDTSNETKIAEGAAFFKERCFACHSMKYLRFDEVSLDAGINPKDAVVWGKDSWKGNPPPDLSLVATTKGVEWLYGYLKGYYFEDGRYDNIIWQNTSMPNPYPDLQGKQVLIMTPEQIRAFNPRFYQVLKLDTSGSISAHAFNDKIDALLHYLVYASDPSVQERHTLGPMVLIFVLTLTLFAFLLYRDFYKDIE